MSRLAERVLGGAQAEIERRGLAPYLYASRRHPGRVVVAVDGRSEDDEDAPSWASGALLEANILYRAVRNVELWHFVRRHWTEPEMEWKRYGVRTPALHGRGWAERLGAFPVDCLVPEEESGG